MQHVEQLRQLQDNEFVRLVLEHTPLAVAVSLGAEHRLALLNPAAEELLGLPAVGVVGRLPETIIPEAMQSARGAFSTASMPAARSKPFRI